MSTKENGEKDVSDDSTTEEAPVPNKQTKSVTNSNRDTSKVTQ